jgi:hypothetical protein
VEELEVEDDVREGAAAMFGIDLGDGPIDVDAGDGGVDGSEDTMVPHLDLVSSLLLVGRISFRSSMKTGLELMPSANSVVRNMLLGIRLGLEP